MERGNLGIPAMGGPGAAALVASMMLAFLCVHSPSLVTFRPPGPVLGSPGNSVLGQSVYSGSVLVIDYTCTVSVY